MTLLLLTGSSLLSTSSRLRSLIVPCCSTYFQDGRYLSSRSSYLPLPSPFSEWFGQSLLGQSEHSNPNGAPNNTLSKQLNLAFGSVSRQDPVFGKKVTDPLDLRLRKN
ncbi:hypothetical protein PP707_02655 [Acetobacter pasteurianus]|nr:hypothetical protein [Acetobacter pasteurianus]